MKVLHPDIAAIVTPGEQKPLTGWTGAVLDKLLNGMDFSDRRDPERVAWIMSIVKIALCTLSSTSYTRMIHTNGMLQEIVVQLEVYVGRLKAPTA